MPKYINADEMLSDESEAYIRAQTKISDIETYALNYLVHAKIQRLLHDAPAAAVAPVAVAHGRWVPTEAPFINECEDCSVCGYRTVWGHGFNYCPNCGARMDASEKA